MQLIDMIADERRTLADLLEGLTPEQLVTPSLCVGWTVHHVAAHLAMPLDTRMRTFFAAMLVARGDFDKANLRLTARYAARPVGELAGILRSNAAKAFKPPGMPLTTPLTDLLIHGQDIRRPLGLTRDFPAERVVPVLDLLRTAPRGFAGRYRGGTRWDGLALAATDVDWSYGSGPKVQGPAEALMLVMSGRRAGLSDLDGDGVPVLKERLG
jgi:uncharacterized protein (TIGR03083 family)